MSAQVTTMLFQEIADRTDGQFTLEEDYNNANAIYMGTDMDKDQFCAIWKEYHNNPLVSIMLKQMQRMWSQANTDAQHIHQLEVNLDAEREKSQTLIETIEQNAQADKEGTTYGMATWLVEVADRKCGDIETQKLLREQAMQLVGERKYYAILMQHGCPEGMDVARIAELLTDTTL